MLSMRRSVRGTVTAVAVLVEKVAGLETKAEAAGHTKK